MTRTRRFLGGLAFGYANQALVTLVGLWLTAFLLTRLGQADYGLWLVGTRILGYLMLLDLGIVALLPRETAFATGRAGGSVDAQALRELVGRTTRLVLWQMPLVALAGTIVWLALPADWEALRNPLGIVMAVFVLQFPLRVLQATLQGLQELSFLGGVYTLAWTLGTALTVVLVLAGWGLYALAVGWSATQLLSSLLWWTRLRRKYPGVLLATLPRFPRRELKDRLSRSAWISLSQVAQVLLQGTDLLIVGKIMGPGAVVPYFCTAKVLTVLGHQ
ncbi:MAG: oligosaccharide flippase family protein, partial [Gemmatimonadales bacterium]